MKAVIYTRVSTDQQADSKLGLEAQMAACLRFCALKGWEVEASYVDAGVSGKEDLSAREGLTKALAHKDATLVVYSLSRLSRRQSLTWALLDEKGAYRVRLASATESFETVTPMGRAMLGMLAVWAALEADLTSERTKEALRAKKARGERIGRVPATEGIPETVALIRALWSSGNFRSYAAVARHLNRTGVATSHGGLWHTSTVWRLCGDNIRKSRKDVMARNAQ